MNLKEIIVPRYLFKDELGDFLFSEVRILVDADSTITGDLFNQENDDYSISSIEIEKMNIDAAQIFFNDKYKKILKKEYDISFKELNGIRLFLGVNWSELSTLLGLDKSMMSRFKQDGKIQKDTGILIMEKMKNEIDTPGATRNVIKSISTRVEI